MLNKILLSVSIVSLVIGTSFASVNNTITSKGYVDTEIDTKQLTIPAAGTPGVGAGETVVTYTATEGALGERGLYTGGTYTAADADKLITASALNGAFTNLPTLETNRLACANPGTCDLWTITPQTAYGRAAASCPDLMSLIGVSEAGRSSGFLSNNGQNSSNIGVYGITHNGEFVVDYGNKGKVHGYARCSTRSATDPWIGNNGHYVLQSDGTTTTLPDSTGQYCYCQLDGYTPDGGTLQSLSAPWVFSHDYDDAEDCANNCAGLCANGPRYDYPNFLAFRAVLFGSVCD